MGSDGIGEEGIVVVEVGKSLVVVLLAFDAMNHILKRRIRSTSVATTARVSTKIMAGDFVSEVNDEGVEGAIESVHLVLLVMVGVDDGKVVEMYVPQETNLLSKASPSYEELLPLVISLDPPPTIFHHRSYSIALKSLLGLSFVGHTRLRLLSHPTRNSVPSGRDY